MTTAHLATIVREPRASRNRSQCVYYHAYGCVSCDDGGVDQLAESAPAASISGENDQSCLGVIPYSEPHLAGLRPQGHILASYTGGA